MSHRTEIDTILKQVAQWPPADRVSLAHEILRAARSDELPPPPRDTFRHALGIARGPGPAPTDEEVEQWIDEHRMSKYGR